MTVKPKIPAAGAKLREWIYSQAENAADLEPAIAELCMICDRLAQVRAEIAAAGVICDGKKNPILDAEIKLSGQFVKLWRMIGLADKPETQRRAVGRPAGGI